MARLVLSSVPNCSILRNLIVSEPIYAKCFSTSSALGAKPAMMAPSKKAAKGKLGPTVEKKKIPVETDPHKLVNFVCGSNIMKEGKDIELKPDSEYPEWLWQLRLDGPPTLEDLDPETLEYWRRVRKLAMRRNMVMLKLKKF